MKTVAQIKDRMTEILDALQRYNALDRISAEDFTAVVDLAEEAAELAELLLAITYSRQDQSRTLSDGRIKDGATGEVYDPPWRRRDD